MTLGKPLNLSEFSGLILPDGSHSPWPAVSRGAVSFSEIMDLNELWKRGLHQRNLRCYDYDGHFIPLVPWLAHLLWELLGLSLPPLAAVLSCSV